ncbi:uncharacterized protein [Fopius arisanus]|uniref:Uncharacterized protein n=1 Tax=Fopius arisanus TaxID=64838 RepID=A0A9R1TNI1_9HYME|nr:PREDICTED: uncharacterized protein LOC105272339 [Fopius arisanus]
MLIEIAIQKTTVVTILGPFDPPPVVIEPQYQAVQLADVERVQGHVRLDVYIKVKIEQQRAGNGVYGSGAITDGYYRIPVNVSAFDVNFSPEVGTHVLIQGELRRNQYGKPLIQIQDMAGIQVVGDRIMPPEELQNGFRVPPVEASVINNAPMAVPAAANRAKVGQHADAAPVPIAEAPVLEKVAGPIVPEPEDVINSPPIEISSDDERDHQEQVEASTPRTPNRYGAKTSEVIPPSNEGLINLYGADENSPPTGISQESPRASKMSISARKKIFLLKDDDEVLSKRARQNLGDIVQMAAGRKLDAIVADSKFEEFSD